MDNNTNARMKAKAWRNSKKNSYEFLKHYMGDLLDDDWQDKLKKMTKKEFLEYMYSGKIHEQAQRWIEKQVSSRY